MYTLYYFVLGSGPLSHPVVYFAQSRQLLHSLQVRSNLYSVLRQNTGCMRRRKKEVKEKPDLWGSVIRSCGEQSL